MQAEIIGDRIDSQVRQSRSTDALDEIDEAVREVAREVRRLESSARDQAEPQIARELERVKRRLEEVEREIQKAEQQASKAVHKAVREARDGEVVSEVRVERRTDGWRQDRERDRRHHVGERRYGYGVDPFGTYVGTLFGAQPFYPALPGLRYNRVDGFVLGMDVQPMRLTSSRRSKIYGQIGYAFGLDDVRYQVGFETRLGGSRVHRARAGLTLGASYQENTVSDDTWKIDPWENTLASFLFRNDFLDYYEAEGFNVYAVKSLPGAMGSVRVGFASEAHRSLVRNTKWSVFRDSDFRFNPAIDDGRLSALVVQLEAGDFTEFGSHPSGGALRAVAELGDGFGGDFAFNRYILDGRIYQPMTPYMGFAVRGRAGYATDGVPAQRLFTAGGIGTVRAYPQNVYAGRSLALGNAEISFSDVDMLIADAQLFAFADAAWVGADFVDFDRADVFSAAGIGVAFDERRLRLEIAWPLDDANQKKPTVWFRINPTF